MKWTIWTIEKDSRATRLYSEGESKAILTDVLKELLFENIEFCMRIEKK